VISALKTERGLALQDLLSGAYEYMATLELKPQARVYLLDQLATVEYVVRLIRGSLRSHSFPDIVCRQAPVRRSR
jgi:hypothetical protein